MKGEASKHLQLSPLFRDKHCMRSIQPSLCGKQLPMVRQVEKESQCYYL